MNYGFVRVATAVPSVKVANCEYNISQMEELIIQACESHAEVICFPELSVTSYTCQDLFHQELLLEEAELAFMKLVDATRSMNIIVIVGLPISFGGVLYNCAAVFFKGKILGYVPKSYLPNYQEFICQIMESFMKSVGSPLPWICLIPRSIMQANRLA